VKAPLVERRQNPLPLARASMFSPPSVSPTSEPSKRSDQVPLVVVPREERYLEARFPVEYPAYKGSVRRWL